MVTAPEPEDGLLQLDELITHDLHESIDSTNRSAIVGWGMVFMVLHQARAILHLHRHGFCFAASPNRRTAIEYAVHLVWLADEREKAVDVLNRGLQGDQIQFAKRIEEAGLRERIPQEAYQVLLDTLAVGLPPEPDERLLKFQHLLDEYGYSELKVVYMAEARLGHVSLTGAQVFSRSTEEGLILSQHPLLEPVACERLCLIVLFDAMLAFNTLLVGNPWTEALRRIAANHGLTPALPTRRQP